MSATNTKEITEADLQKKIAEADQRELNYVFDVFCDRMAQHSTRKVAADGRPVTRAFTSMKEAQDAWDIAWALNDRIEQDRQSVRSSSLGKVASILGLSSPAGRPIYDGSAYANQAIQSPELVDAAITSVMSTPRG